MLNCSRLSDSSPGRDNVGPDANAYRRRRWQLDVCNAAIDEGEGLSVKFRPVAIGSIVGAAKQVVIFKKRADALGDSRKIVHEVRMSPSGLPPRDEQHVRQELALADPRFDPLPDIRFGQYTPPETD